MKRVLLDQGLPFTASVALRNAGWDSVHVREVGLHQAEDIEILKCAANESRAVITLDRDFPEILALTGAARPSVVLLRKQGLKAAGVVELVKSVWREYEAALDRGCVLIVSAKGTRVRSLPLK